jgi:hypothetical protein
MAVHSGPLACECFHWVPLDLRKHHGLARALFSTSLPELTVTYVWRGGGRVEQPVVQDARARAPLRRLSPLQPSP